MRSLSNKGRVTAPDTSGPMVDSTKTTTLISQASNPAERRVRTSPRSVMNVTRPLIPPENWVNVRSAPIMTVSRMIMVLSASPNTAISSLTDWIAPSSGFQSLRIVHAIQIPANRDR